MTKKRILITGVMGFIGTNLAEKLLQEDCEIIGVDNFSSSKRERIEKFGSNPQFTFLERDITTLTEIKGRIDEIYHLACPSRHPSHILIENPLIVMHTNVDGIRNVLELGRRKGAKILYLSSSEVYGIPTEFPTPETNWGNVNPVGARSSYAESKRFCEAYCQAFRDKYATEIKIVRPFNIYGKYMDEYDGRVIPLFIRNALKHEALTVYGDGSHTRCFCYIGDAIEGIFKMMQTEKRFMGPVNSGNPEEVRIQHLAEEIIRLTGSHSLIDHSRGFPPDDSPRRVPDVTLAKNKLGWTAKIRLDKGLKKTIRYFKDLLNF